MSSKQHFFPDKTHVIHFSSLYSETDTYDEDKFVALLGGLHVEKMLLQMLADRMDGSGGQQCSTSVTWLPNVLSNLSLVCYTSLKRDMYTSPQQQLFKIWQHGYIQIFFSEFAFLRGHISVGVVANVELTLASFAIVELFQPFH